MDHQTKKSSTNLGRYFTWIAWCIALALLVFVFQDLLDKQWNPNQSPEYSLSERGKAQVRLTQNRAGHYITQGNINGESVVFLLDTGATNVSIPLPIAETLNLPRYGSHIAQTANGKVRVFQTRLDELNIGNLFLYNIEASINPGMESNEILLGMSALKHIEFSQRGKELILQER